MVMTEKEYREAPGINSTALGAFYESPDSALMEVEPKGYFEIGDIFETLVQDITTGSDLFSQRYFVAPLQGNIPDKVCKWLDDGTDLQTCFAYNKDGVTRSKRSENVHAWLDACIDCPGLKPVSQDMMAQINKMVKNLLKVEIYGAKLSELLAKADFQVPIFWTKNGVKKKALVDALVSVELNGEPTRIVFDLKTAVNYARFYSMFRSKYWIQSTHYVEGVVSKLGAAYPKMIFLNAFKDEPCLAQPFELDDSSLEPCQEKYDELCISYSEWVLAGKPPVGWKPLQQIKVFV